MQHAPPPTTNNRRRAGEAPSVGLTEQLQELGFVTDRLKTGTPARVDRRTVDFSQMAEQPGDDPVSWFSYDAAWHVEREQMSCYLTHTNAETHDLIRANLHETPTYGGWADSKGPRYCPSIEDKIVRFADRERHQIFIEPEGRSTPELYIQVRRPLLRAVLRTRAHRACVKWTRACASTRAGARQDCQLNQTSLQRACGSAVCRCARARGRGR